MEARLRDDFVWRRHWIRPQGLVIEFVDIAVAEVNEETGLITFDRTLAGDLEQHLLFDHILPLILAKNGRIVLHGAVISLQGSGVVLVGDTGAGKSTLTAFAWQHGWTVGSDDGAVLLPGRPPTVEPTYATLRLTPESLELLGLGEAAVGDVVGKVRIGANGLKAFRQAPVDLQAIVVIEPASEAAVRFERLDGVAAHAELFGSTFHVGFSRGSHLRTVVDGLASVIESAAVGRLSVPRTIHGLAGAELLLRQLIETRERSAIATPGELVDHSNHHE